MSSSDITPLTFFQRLSAEETFIEESFSTTTHAMGLILAVIGVVYFMKHFRKEKWGAEVWSCVIFCSTLVLMYTVSTIYHFLLALQSLDPTSQDLAHLIKFFQDSDHVAIFALIAGTYTPVSLSIRMIAPKAAWTGMSVMWGVAVAGVVIKLTWSELFAQISNALYVAMGSLGAFSHPKELKALPSSGKRALLYGGLTYAAGVVFYMWNSLPFNHAIWHLYVLGGSGLHYYMVYILVIIPRTEEASRSKLHGSAVQHRDRVSCDTHKAFTAASSTAASTTALGAARMRDKIQ